MGVAGERCEFPDAEECVTDLEAAFRPIYKEELPLACQRAAWALGPSWAAHFAEDIGQEACIRLWKAFKADPSALADQKRREKWMKKVTRNLVRDTFKTRFRADARQFRYHFSSLREKHDWRKPVLALPERGLRQAMVAALAALSEHKRECFLRKHRDGDTYKAIGEALGIKVKRVEKNLAAAKTALRKAESTYKKEEA